MIMNQPPATQPDPFYLGPEILASDLGLSGQWWNNRGFRDTNAKTLGTQTLNLANKNLILITMGQSNIENVAPNALSLVNPTKIDNFNIYDGAIYQYADPVLGCSWILNGTGVGGASACPGNPAADLADAFVTATTFDRVIVVPIAIGGSVVADWATGVLSYRCKVTMLRLAARGITPQANVTFGAIWGQGESDHGTSQAAYQTAATTAFNGLLNNGFSGRIFVAQQTWNVGTTDANVRAAQAALVDNVNIFAGPDADTLNATNRQSDNIHWNNTGRAAYAALWKTAMHASGAPY